MDNTDAPKDHPTVVRLPVELRAGLLAAAANSKRSLSKEIVMRLGASFQNQAPLTTYSFPASSAAIPIDDRPKDSTPLNDHDRAVLALFRQLPPEKQLSLLTLLR